jgi:GntR family transcriptional repressor for pyruvate dehydrogenase complex
MKPTVLSLKPIRRNVSLVENVAQEISNYILEGLLAGKLKKGDQLPSERELSESLGIGRSTLREAIKVLTMLGLLEIRSGQGTFITSGTTDFYAAPLAWGLIIGEKSVAELVEARLLIDSEAAYLAAMRANGEEIHEIETAFRNMEIAYKNGDTEKFTEEDVNFHMALAKAAHNAVFFQVTIAIRKLLEIWIEKVLVDVDSVHETLKEHEVIYKCILERDAEGAREGVRHHIHCATARLIQVSSNLNKE